MSHLHDVADFAAPGTYVKIVPQSHRRITPAFNVALFAFLALKGMLVYLSTPLMARGPSPLVAFGLGPILLSSFFDLIRMVAMVLISAVFLKAFWGRLVSSLGSLRPISYSEAIAILLMAALVFGG